MTTREEILQAVQKNDSKKVSELLKSDPSLVNSKTDNGVSALLLSVYYGRKDITKLLLDRGAALNIFEASALGKLESVKEFVDKQPNLVNSYSEDGFTPLGLASYFGHANVVEFLLSKRADVNAVSKNSRQVMPLHSAVSSRQTAIAKLLLAKGADPNAKQQAGLTPLHSAAHNGQVEMIKLLLSHKADINAQMDDGRTPLSMALEGHQAEVINLLREHGATE